MKKTIPKKEWKWILCAAVLLQVMGSDYLSVKAEQVSFVQESQPSAHYKTLLPHLKNLATPSNVTEELSRPSVPLPEEEQEGTGQLKKAVSIANQLKTSLKGDAQTGDLWLDWAGDMDFTGDGDEEAPYQIRTLSQLMGLSESVAAGNSYEGKYFELVQDIDLGGIWINNGNWNPIGWYQNEKEIEEEVLHPFKGIFDGRGNTIYGLKILDPSRNLRNIGLFGSIEGGTIKHLNVVADDISGTDRIAVLAGSIGGDTVIYDVTVSGYLHGESVQGTDADSCKKNNGNTGGISGYSHGGSRRVTVENCKADGIVINSQSSEGCVGGIVGEAHRTDLVDNQVYTQDGTSDRIQGKGYVGGIAGNMDQTNIYNSYVDGTIGGNKTKAVGGIVGKYESGNLVLARFAGDISRTNNGTAACEGTFIGTRESRDTFTYGTEKSNNLSYLFTNTAAKAKNIFGSKIDGDNSYTKSARIGYWTDNETKYTILSGNMETKSQELYFYEELEEGVRSVITRKLGNEFTAEGAAKDLRFRLDHFAPGYQGEPVRGYLLSVPRIDAKNANGTYDTDVALLTALPNGNQSYYRSIDKDRGAAVAPGIGVTVVTAPKNTNENRYQMIVDGTKEGGVKPPTYIDEDGQQVPMNYVAGGSYSFIMPERDTEINVRYQKVTTRLLVSPEETEISVIHTRSGDRKNPDTRTEVRNKGGTLIARYLNGVPDTSVEVQPIGIHGEHNSYGDTTDRSMKWAIDDPDLLQMTVFEGYTTEDARILPNLSGSFIQEILNREIQTQADSQYQEIIQPTIYEKNGVVTATTNPQTSVDGQPVYGNCRVTVKFQILDQTTRRVEGLTLNKSDIVYTVIRKLTGDRKNPKEEILCTEPVILSAKLFPQQPFLKNVTWKDQESQQIITLAQSGEHGEDVVVGIRCDTGGKENPAWIQNVINEDNQKRKDNPYAKLAGSAKYEEAITATSEDQTNGIVSGKCHVTIRFVTVDETMIHPESVHIDKRQVTYDLRVKKEGNSQSKTVEESGFQQMQLNGIVEPQCEDDDAYKPYENGVIWSVSDSDALQIKQDGTIIPNRNAAWIKEALTKAPYTASKTVWVTAQTKDNGISDKIPVTLNFQAECMAFSQNKAVFDLVLTKTGRRTNPIYSWAGAEEKQNKAVSYPQEKTVTYKSSKPEVLTVNQNGTCTPVLNPEAQWIKTALSYPYKSTETVTLSASNGTCTDTCAVTLNIKVVDKTTSSGGGSGSSGGSGGGSAGGVSTGVTPAGSRLSSAAPAGSVTGTWIQTADGRWTFTSGGRTYNSEWAYIHNPYADAQKGQKPADWFRFDSTGHMVTGWFTDQDGNKYYLNPLSDNTLGRMVTGWSWIQGEDGKMRCYYFNQVSDGTKGALLRNTATPDGYLVNSDGMWIVNGTAILR